MYVYKNWIELSELWQIKLATCMRIYIPAVGWNELIYNTDWFCWNKWGLKPYFLELQF